MTEPNNDGSAAELKIANEYTSVRVRKVHTRNGERLEISSAKLGHTILLDALELESLTWQPKSTFSKFLSNPFGPIEEFDN